MLRAYLYKLCKINDMPLLADTNIYPGHERMGGLEAIICFYYVNNYMWILRQEKNYRQYSLLTWNSSFGQLVYPVGG